MNNPQFCPNLCAVLKCPFPKICAHVHWHIRGHLWERWRADPEYRRQLLRGARLPKATSSNSTFQWISTRQLIADAIKLAGLVPQGLKGVLGIPRSGMIPASIIATHLHLPLFILANDQPTRCWTSGSRGCGVAPRGEHLLVVDDTTFSGAAMQRVRGVLRRHRAIYAAVYVNSLRSESKRAVDLFARELPAPHLLEWNIANNGPIYGRWLDVPAWGDGGGWDIDGIIVHDEESGGRPGTPYITPRLHPCKLIVTGRPESGRAHTEQMLKGLGVRWERLEMLPDNAPQTWEAIAQNKAKHFASTRCGIFLESDNKQAKHIHELTGRPVVCPRIERVFQ